ncbi:TRAP transporter permease [Chelativorans sp. YIM 93263]|uniref:TRAP transporter permease n=1 Tax=Chelativorans sp. YIM 93263 TaxID=2906648 RepID=UPI00237934A9|nr:TRAP transporter fused permease subunit [Chelativorans sp. YIM 93263]
MNNTFKAQLTLRNATFILSVGLFAMLLNYFFTGAGGGRHLAVLLVPMALVIQTLVMHQNGGLYPRLPRWLNYGLVLIYAAACFYSVYYFYLNYEQIAIWRQGRYTTHDFIVGLMVLLVVMELSRLAHPLLFWVNVVLMGYTLWGHLSPIDFFWHPGTSLYRVVTSSTVELATGVYGRYAQLALTLIAAFLLLAAAARGFGAQGALVHVMQRIAGRSRHTIPQTSVLASVSVGMVSGSGAANTAVTGSFTIPLMMRYGVPGTFAGAVETAASMGGLIMPPLMAVAGFLMAEFLGVPYWDVVLRGFAIAFVYFASLILAVYLLSVRLLPRDPITAPNVPLYDWCKTAIFFAGIILLMVLMGWYGYGALRAALFTAGFLFAALMAAWMLFMFVLKDPEVTKDARGEPDYIVGLLLIVGCLLFAYAYRDTNWGATIWIAAALGFGIVTFIVPSLLRRIRVTIETHAEMTAYLTLLMATLGIMIGLFTVTGFINRMGSMLLQIGQLDMTLSLGVTAIVIPGIVITVVMGWIFGWLAGTGLPPTATYIIVAIIVVPPLRQLGIDPWVAHFFAFLLAIWGELSPPTSLTAAVASRIANVSFMRTMWEALKICLPITFMSFAIFVRENMVVEPGWLQVRDTLIVAVGTCGVTFATFGRFMTGRGLDSAMRICLALLSFVVIFHPDDMLAVYVGALVLPSVVFGIWRHRQVSGRPAESKAEAEAFS